MFTSIYGSNGTGKQISTLNCLLVTSERLSSISIKI